MELSAPGSSGAKIMTMMQLYKIMQRHQNGSFAEKIDFLQATLMSREGYSLKEKTILRGKLRIFKNRIKTRWQAAKRRNDLFLIQNHNWLTRTIDLPIAATKQGRPKIPFIELSKRGKRKRTEQIRKLETEELRFATESKLRESGELDASKLMRDITATPTRAKKLRKAYIQSMQNETKQLSLLNALAIYVDADLSRAQYDIIRTSDKKLFPCYKRIQAAKTDCYPVEEAFRVTATCAEVLLQPLLDHTATRLFTYLSEVVANLDKSERAPFELISKWGCHGSQQMQYKQKFDNKEDSDSQIIQSSMLPLRLIYGTDIIWQNPSPSSPRYCRPIRLRLRKETTDIIREEIEYIKTQITDLKYTKIEVEGSSLSVKHTMILTMVDGKVCNALTNTASTIRCYICGATSKHFNELSRTPEVDPNTIKFGLSILHARIRLFETLLHLAYKLPLRKWQVKTEADKNVMKAKKKEIQDQFRIQLGLLVDVPKQGYGNTNDGNTSRRFFKNPRLSAEITGVGMRLIRRFKVILEAISSGREIDLNIFEVYCRNTAKLYIRLYSWHPMTPTVHKILIHGPLVVANALVPIGQLSEEAAEARNKHIRSFRLHHARKFSREQCNRDVLNRLLLTSDPLISSMRKRSNKKSEPFLKETRKLFVPTESSDDEDEDEDESEDEDENEDEDEDEEEEADQQEDEDEEEEADQQENENEEEGEDEEEEEDEEEDEDEEEEEDEDEDEDEEEDEEC